MNQNFDHHMSLSKSNVGIQMIIYAFLKGAVPFSLNMHFGGITFQPNSLERALLYTYSLIC